MPLISRVSKGQTITAEKMNTIIDALNEVRVTAVVGGQFSRGLGGTTITVPKSQGGGAGIVITYPFQYYRSGEGFGLRAGTINGIIQNNTAPTFSLESCYVNLECTTDGTQLQTAEVLKVFSPPDPVATTPEVAPSTFKVSLYYIDEDLKLFRTIGTSPIMAIPQEMIKESITGVEFGELPYRSWYSWVFAS